MSQRIRPATAVLLVLLLWAVTEVGAILLTPVVNSVLTEPVLTRGRVLASHRAKLDEFLAQPQPRARFDPALGWAYRPAFARGGDTINQQGLRSSREYSSETDRPRIAAFGDSFVYCNEVANPDCWVAQLETQYGIDALNYGVGGYGLDQALLRYAREGAALSPDVVLIGFTPDDLGRVVNRYRGFISPSEGPWFKPRFLLEGDRLVRMDSPAESAEEARSLLNSIPGIRAAGASDHWYRPTIYENPLYRFSPTFRLAFHVWHRVSSRALNPDRLYDGGVFHPESEAFRLQLAIFSSFVDTVRAQGRQPVILFMPTAEDMGRIRNGDSSTYAPLVARLEQGDVRVLDPVREMEESIDDIPALFAPGGHYSPLGNATLARAVASYLELEDP